MPPRPNPLKLNPLQLKTLAILQELARSEGAEPLEDGRIVVHRLPHAHGDHLHVGGAMVAARDAVGLGNPSVWGALERKGLIAASPEGHPILTTAALDYDTGIAEQILHRGGH